MKKLSLYIFLCLLWCNTSFAEIKTYECREIHDYVDSQDWGTQFYYDDEKATLIVDKEVYNDKWGSLMSGKATLIYENIKREFEIWSMTVAGFEAYNHSKIDKETIQKHKPLKKYKGKLDYVSYLDFRVQSIERNFYDLYYVFAGGLWTIETNINQASVSVKKFVCKE